MPADECRRRAMQADDGGIECHRMEATRAPGLLHPAAEPAQRSPDEADRIGEPGHASRQVTDAVAQMVHGHPRVDPGLKRTAPHRQHEVHLAPAFDQRGQQAQRGMLGPAGVEDRVVQEDLQRTVAGRTGMHHGAPDAGSCARMVRNHCSSTSAW